MVTTEDIVSKKATIAIIGLGYVGLPLTAAFGKKTQVIGYDISPGKITQLQEGLDETGELTASDLAATSIDFTLDASRLKEATFLIVTVPTPVDDHHKPDLSPMISASRTIGRNLIPGSIIVQGSTVYPGVTEELYVPILEA